MKIAKAMKTLAIGIAASAFITVAVPAIAEDLVMWERTGGNAAMVDKLVELWNAKNPDRKITSPTSRTPRWCPSSRRPSPRAKCPT